MAKAKIDRRGVRTPAPAEHRSGSVGRPSVVCGNRNRDLLLLTNYPAESGFTLTGFGRANRTMCSITDLIGWWSNRAVAQIHAHFRERADFLPSCCTCRTKPEIVRSMMDRTDIDDNRIAFELRKRYREQNSSPFDPDRRKKCHCPSTVLNVPF